MNEEIEMLDVSDSQKKEDYSYLLNYPCRNLINYIRELDEEKIKEILKDSRIKQKIIDSSDDKYAFIHMMQDASFNVLKRYLLDEEGIYILSNTTNLEDKLRAIISIGSLDVNNFPILEHLAENEMFCQMILDNRLDIYFSHLNFNSACKFYEFIERNGKRYLSSINLFDDNVLVNLSKKYQFSIEVINDILKKGDNKEICEILLNDSRITTLSNFLYKSISNYGKNNIEIPSHLINESNFVKNVSSTNSSRDYRYLINRLEKNHDISILEKSRKKYINHQLSTLNINDGIFQNYNDCLKELQELFEKDGNYYGTTEMNNIIDKYINDFGNGELEKFYYGIEDFMFENDFEGLKKYFQIETKIELTNMIIDYHFEDLPYNVLINIDEVMHYQNNTRQILSDSDVKLYNKILDMDNLSIPEILELHTKLLDIDIKSKFYDDYKKIKDDQVEDIRKSILNEETIKQYQNQEMSQKYGVPIYYLDGQPFYAFVKSMGFDRDMEVKDYVFQTQADMPSFSLTSHNKLQTFHDPRNSISLIFSDFEPQQVIHTFPYDSSSEYNLGSRRETTDKVNKLYSKEEMTTVGRRYNEILYKAQNKNKTDELNQRLINPRVLGVYVYDEVFDEALEYAKANHLPIVLVNTKKYPQTDAKLIDKAQHVSENKTWTSYDYDLDQSKDVDSTRRTRM